MKSIYDEWDPSKWDESLSEEMFTQKNKQTNYPFYNNLSCYFIPGYEQVYKKPAKKMGWWYRYMKDNEESYERIVEMYKDDRRDHDDPELEEYLYLEYIKMFNSITDEMLDQSKYKTRNEILFS